MKQIAKYYDDTGMLDFIGVVGSGCDTHNTLANVIPNMSYPPEPFLHLAAGIKEVVKVPVLHAQNIKDPNQATRILEGGYVDMVGMTRAHIADPHLIAKIKMGQIDQIKQCVGANYCIDRQYQGLDVLCIQNAATSREYMGVPHIIEKSTGPKRKVVVVGAGPAGMEAARVAAERGHDVTLFEKKEFIGGQITTAAKAPQRDQIAGITRWYQLELARLKVDLRLGTAADVATIQDLRPDVIVLAVGGHPFLEQNEHGAPPKGWWSAAGTCSTARSRRARTCWCTTPSASSPACRWPTSSPTRAARSRSSPTTSSRAWPSAVRRSRPTTAACTPKK
jgi:NADPH-dependent 2,4-dienoyl-CoA reductase/sulfur reductase-like enzyme